MENNEQQTQQQGQAEPQSQTSEPIKSETPTAQEILSRSAGAKKEGDPQSDPTNISTDDLRINPSDLDQIKDPVARRMVEERYKAWESGFNKKFEQIANLRKDLESRTQEMSSWSPERLKAEMSKPDFVNAAQSLQQQAAPNQWEGSQEEWSALSEEDKAQFAQLNQKVLKQEQQMASLLQSQEDEKLASKYPDYNPNAINEFQTKLMNGSYIATREDLWKAINHDKAVEAAYKLGLQDKNAGLNEKVNASSIGDNVNVTSSNQVSEDILNNDKLSAGEKIAAHAKMLLAKAKQGNQ